MNEIEQFLQKTPAASQWARIGVRHHHGICVPLFSLHSNESCGIGEFHDLIPLFRWCRSIGLDIIQLLPLNDTGNDQSPYNALSAFALNPVHISLVHLPQIKGTIQLNGLMRELQILNASPRIDYPKVIALKTQFLWEYYQTVFPFVRKEPAFQRFCEANPWVKEYARFKALKVKTNWQSCFQWPQEWKTLPNEDLDKRFQGFDSEVSFHLFLQYLCFTQFQAVKESATDHGIFLKGDIPILISKESADVWANSSLFLTEFNAGAPPDMYNKEGQDWGFPLYNWQEMENQGYAWWKKRLETASRMYDIYRIDHIVGFYRIWGIRRNTSPKHGGFFPPEEWKWLGDGEKIMRQLLGASHMLPIGEDLGVVPPEVRQNLRSIGICGTKVMRWERLWNEDKRYIKFADYEPLSMTTVSTHDSETLRLWWRNQPDDAKEFSKFKGWTYTPVLTNDMQFQILRDSHHTASLFHINLLQEYLALINNMTSQVLEDERINIPGTVSSRNWSYRYIPSVEEIISNPDLNKIMNDMIKVLSYQSK